ELNFNIIYRIGYKDSVYHLLPYYRSKVPLNITATIPKLNESSVCNLMVSATGSTNEWVNGYRYKPNGEWTPEMEVHVSGAVGPDEFIWAMEGTVTGLAATNTHGEDQ
ncbi:hypothetical protein, partial [Pseudomonas helleri]